MDSTIELGFRFSLLEKKLVSWLCMPILKPYWIQIVVKNV